MLKDNHLPLLALDICVPVQEFRVDYTIVQNNQLPFVREFIIRLLDLSNFTKDQLGKFMGFSEKETEVALSQLLNLDEVVVNELGEFQLTAKSMSYFSSQQENRPKIQSLEEVRKGFKFDLLTFSYVKSSVRMSNSNSAVRLYPPSEAISTSAKSAKNAFQRYFHQIHDEEDFGYLNIDKPELYKISSFKKQSEKYQRFSQVYGADIDRNSIEPTITHDFLSQDEIVTFLSDHLRVHRPTNNVQNISAVFNNFDYEYGVSSLKRGYLDVAGYSIESRKLQSSDAKFKPMIGSILLEENWEILLQALKSVKKESSKKKKVELQWIAPSDKYWAQSERQLERFINLSELDYLDLNICLPIPHRKDRKVTKSFSHQFKPIADKLQGFVEGYLTGAEEIIILNKSIAFVNCYLYQNENTLPIPVGFYTQNERVVNLLASSFDTYLCGLDENFEIRDLGMLVKKN